MATEETTSVSAVPSPSCSSSTSDNFQFETRYVVLSLLNQITQEQPRSTSDTDSPFREYFQHWHTKSAHTPLSTPPRKRKKFNKKPLKPKLKPFSSDESINTLSNRNSRNAKKSTISTTPIKTNVQETDERNLRKEKGDIISLQDKNGNELQHKSGVESHHKNGVESQQKNGVESQHKNGVESSDLPPHWYREAPPISITHATFRRSISTGSSSDGSSFFGDADDELSQSSTMDSTTEAKLRDIFRSSKQTLRTPRLSTVISESEGDSDLPLLLAMGSPDDNLPYIGDDGFGVELPTSVTSSPHTLTISDDDDDDDALLQVDNINLEFGGDTNDGIDTKDSPIFQHIPNGRSNSREVNFAAAAGPLFDAPTDSNVSEFESEENIGVKGDDTTDEEEEEEREEELDREEEGKSSAAVGGCEATALPSRRFRSLDRSHLSLNLPGITQTGLPTPPEVESAIDSLREEIQHEISSMESDVEAIRSQNVPPAHRPLVTPMTPCTEVAFILARIGDEVQETHLARVDGAIYRLFQEQSGPLSYEVFRSVARTIIDTSIPGWTEVALLLIYSQGVALRMAVVGGQGVGKMVDYSVQLLTDLMADFIINEGGWSGIVSTESSNSNVTSPEPYSFSTGGSSGMTPSFFNLSSSLPAGDSRLSSSMETNPSPSSLPHGTDSVSSSVDRNISEASPGSQDSLSQHSNNNIAGNSSELVEDSKVSADSSTDVTPQPPSESSQQGPRGDNSSAMGDNSSVGTRSNAAFITGCSTALGVISIGLGLAYVYIKR